MIVSNMDANWVQAPLAAVRYHMIITNRSNQALDPISIGDGPHQGLAITSNVEGGQQEGMALMGTKIDQ